VPDAGLQAFLEQVALIGDVDDWDSSADVISLMTLHSAKGLEFDAVFMVGVEEDLLPHRRSLVECYRGSAEEALEEERRLFHVGMTRARARLFLTFCGERLSGGGLGVAGPSRFLSELPDECILHVAPGKPRQRAKEAGGRSEAAARPIPDAGASPALVHSSDAVEMKPGASMSHPVFGEGEVIDVEPLGKHFRVRIRFLSRGVMTILMPKDELQCL
jgi:DNA helicase-2/ATP-dependent DNA helicase PcrA